MEKTRLLELLKSEPSDIDAIGMILSNYTDYGHSELGGMVSVKKFNEVAECLLEWWDGKNTPTSQEQLATPAVSNRRELLLAYEKHKNLGTIYECDKYSIDEFLSQQ